jgi:hypothetical protein
MKGNPPDKGERDFLVRDLIPSVGLRAKDALNAIIAEQRERLTDVPYSLREAEKQRWIAERWPFDMFESRVSDAWRRWRADFNDEGAEPMAWGEQIRRMVANEERANPPHGVGKAYGQIAADVCYPTR